MFELTRKERTQYVFLVKVIIEFKDNSQKKFLISPSSFSPDFYKRIFINFNQWLFLCPRNLSISEKLNRSFVY